MRGLYITWIQEGGNIDEKASLATAVVAVPISRERQELGTSAALPARACTVYDVDVNSKARRCSSDALLFIGTRPPLPLPRTVRERPLGDRRLEVICAVADGDVVIEWMRRDGGTDRALRVVQQGEGSLAVVPQQ